MSTVIGGGTTISGTSGGLDSAEILVLLILTTFDVKQHPVVEAMSPVPSMVL